MDSPIRGRQARPTESEQREIVRRLKAQALAGDTVAANALATLLHAEELRASRIATSVPEVFCAQR